MAEYLHPGVYLTEVSFRSHPIEGVSTSQTDWTEPNAHDPGVTLLQFPAFAAESLFYRMPAVPHPPHLLALAVRVAWPPDGTPAA
jgi:hypothetical protein